MNRPINQSTQTQSLNNYSIINLTNPQSQSQLQPKLKPKRNVRFTEDTIDNENLNRLRSNICCIFHRKKNNPSDTSSETCTSDSANEIERSYETKKKHKIVCSKYQSKTQKDTNNHKHNNKCCH